MQKFLRSRGVKEDILNFDAKTITVLTREKAPLFVIPIPKLRICG